MRGLWKGFFFSVLLGVCLFSYQIISPVHTDEFSTLHGFRSSQDVGHESSREQSGGQPGWPPGEALGFPHCVLLFPSITSTHKRDGQRDLLKLVNKLA
jgi:hypothetical protein